MTDAFAVLDARVAEQREAWLESWTRWPGREVQAHPAYLELFAGSRDRVLAAAMQSAAGTVLYPFILRTIESSTCTDITSPYGYGGPYAWGADLVALAPRFWSAFDAWTADANVVSEFVRFAVGTRDLLAYPGDRVERQENVVVSCDTTPEAAWGRYEHKVRKNVNKAMAAGVRIVVDERGDQLDAFLRIYLGTMSRRGAHELYRFSRQFFETLNATLREQYCYFHAMRGDEVVSTELALVSRDRIYSFLGGTEESAFELRPNDLLKHEMIAWARAQGKAQFVLGGGYAPGDGIFRYKRSFAPDGVVPFYTGQRILDGAACERLADSHRAAAEREGAEVSAAYFPAYRAPFKAPTGSP